MTAATRSPHVVGLIVSAALVAGAACAAATATPDAGGVAVAGAARGMVPAGYGTLRQDDIVLALRSGPVQVKVTPLDEATIRLLAPDTHARLNALRESRRAAARATTPEPELFLVSFFSYEPDAAFEPEDVQLLHQSRLLRPVAILPVTSGWGRQRLAQQETQSAVYGFAGPIEYDQSFIVRYGTVQNADWQRIVPVLQAERARVAARSG